MNATFGQRPDVRPTTPTNDAPVAARIALAILGHVMVHGVPPAWSPPSNPNSPLGGPGTHLSFPRSRLALKPEGATQLTRTDEARSWKRLMQAGYASGAPNAPDEAATSGVRLATQGSGHPAELELLRLTAEQPGLNIDELSRRLNLSRSATRYHLRGLIRGQRVLTHRQGHHLLHFPSRMTPSQRTAVALLRISSVRLIVDSLMQSPRLHASNMSQSLGFSARSLRRSVKTLVKAGLARVDREPNGSGGSRVTLHPDLRVAWVLYCKDAQPETVDAAATARPAGAWIISLEAILGYLAGSWTG